MNLLFIGTLNEYKNFIRANNLRREDIRHVYSFLDVIGCVKNEYILGKFSHTLRDYDKIIRYLVSHQCKERNDILFDLHNPHPFPLTIEIDRYDGAYNKGGTFIAWNCFAYQVPESPQKDDLIAEAFWKVYAKDGYYCGIFYGTGKTIEKAIINLKKRLARISKPEKEETP